MLVDEGVAGLPLAVGLFEWLEKRASRVVRVRIPAGERSKSVEEYGRVVRQLAGSGLTRDGWIVAVGGGVTGDLAGFVAATYLRGLPVIQIPTTVVAMVDSSVGGKTGIDLPEGKNLVGAFHPPKAVVADLRWLNFLPAAEKRAGMAEVIKYGAKGMPRSMAKVVKRCVEIKAKLAGEDEKDLKGKRALLNFGHTVAHGLEGIVGYQGLRHGEAVAIGMCVAAHLSVKAKGLKKKAAEKLKAAIAAHGLPVTHPDLRWDKLSPVMARDKKATTQGIRWVLLRKIGRADLVSGVTEKKIQLALEEVREGRPAKG
ncbi:MAG: 3-dehydroquinate synthase [Proteobacteria bacterium]|nr:3-dehydroquinate synthase [Pseudomonadota bacterium]